jgi:hypothetical protein
MTSRIDNVHVLRTQLPEDSAARKAANMKVIDRWIREGYYMRDWNSRDQDTFTKQLGEFL